MSRNSVVVTWHDDDLLKIIRDNTDEALFTAGEILLDAAVSGAPEDSGTLKASGYVATQERSSYSPGSKNNKQIKPADNEAVVGFAAFYARFLERGTRKMAARPFMRPALDHSKDTLTQKIVELLRKDLE